MPVHIKQSGNVNCDYFHYRSKRANLTSSYRLTTVLWSNRRLPTPLSWKARHEKPIGLAQDNHSIRSSRLQRSSFLMLLAATHRSSKAVRRRSVVRGPALARWASRGGAEGKGLVGAQDAGCGRARRSGAHGCPASQVTALGSAGLREGGWYRLLQPWPGEARLDLTASGDSHRVSTLRWDVWSGVLGQPSSTVSWPESPYPQHSLRGKTQITLFMNLALQSRS